MAEALHAGVADARCLPIKPETKSQSQYGARKVSLHAGLQQPLLASISFTAQNPRVPDLNPRVPDLNAAKMPQDWGSQGWSCGHDAVGLGERVIPRLRNQGRLIGVQPRYAHPLCTSFMHIQCLFRHESRVLVLRYCITIAAS